MLLIFLIDFFEMVLMLFFPGSNSKNGGRMVSCHPRNCLPSPSGHLLPRLFDSSCDGGKTHGGGDSDVGGGGDGACGGGDSVSFLLPTLPALACLVVPPPSSTGDPSPVLSGNLAMADMDHQHHRFHDYDHHDYHHHHCQSHAHHHHLSLIMLSGIPAMVALTDPQILASGGTSEITYLVKNER